MKSLNGPSLNHNLPERVPLLLTTRDSERLPYSYGSQPSSDVKAYWGIVYRRKYLILSVLLGAIALSAVMILRTKRTYTATSTILVEPGTPQILDVKDLESGAAPGTYEHDYYETEYDILKSRSLAAQVVRQLDLMNNDAFLERRPKHGLMPGELKAAKLEVPHEGAAAGPVEIPRAQIEVPVSIVNEYLGGLDVKPKIGTRLIAVSYIASDPKLAARIANAHVQAYITRGMELHSQASREAEVFLKKKVVEIKAQVEKSEAALNTYRHDNGIVSATLGDEGNKVVLQRLTELNAALNRCEEAKIYLESEHQQIQRGDYESLPEVIRSPLIQGLKQQVAKLAEEYASMSNRFNPGYHPLDDLKAELDDSQARLHREIGVIVDGVESDYRIQVARADKLHSEIDKVTVEAMARNDAALHDAILARQVETNRGLYQNVLRRLAEIGVTANRPSSNVSIVDVAEPPTVPSSPNIKLDLARGALLGLLGGLALSFILEYFDDSLKNRAEVEQFLRVPSLGQVPVFRNMPRVTNGSKPSLPGPAAGTQLTADSDGRWPVTEAFRVIRNTILFARPGEAPRTVLVTSALGGEGKTTTAINTAVAFARLSGRTLLIDADLRRPKCYEIFGLSNKPGLTDRLLGQKKTDEVIQRTQFNGLHLMSAGLAVSNPGELLASPQMRQLLSELTQKYDRILIDSAPLVPVSDTEGLAALADAAVVVASSNSSKQIVQNACSRLELVGGKLFGIVLNRVSSGLENYRYPYYPRVGREESPLN